MQSEHTTSLFCQMIAQLSELSQAAKPTPFHNMLRALDDSGKLLRVYTQNIDAIESKSGLSFGVPEFDDRRYKPRSKGKSADDCTLPSVAEESGPSNRPLTPPAETPRCIPLHGTLQNLHCQTCTHSFPLEDHLPALTSGTPPQCPECTVMEETRQLVGKRARGVGKLRPSVVLYNEAHKDGEGVGEIVRRDLVGGFKGKGRSGADLLLVVGTSLRVPGTKRMVREFSKAVRARAPVSTSKEASASGLQTPAPSPRRSPATDEEPPMRSFYLNLDFPVPTREWEGVFDVWLQGDAQEFARLLREGIDKETQLKQAAAKRKQDREAEAALAVLRARQVDAQQARKGKKRKTVPESPSEAAMKRRKVAKAGSLPTATKRATARTQSKPPVPKLRPQTERNHPKLMLRIPARPKHPPGRRLEVYISTPPSSSATPVKAASVKPLSPASRGNIAKPHTPRTTTRAGWKAAQAAGD